MMKSLLISLLLIILVMNSYATSKNDNAYDIKKIPAELLKNGGAVIRNDQKTFDIEDYKYATLKVKYAVTIFNKEQQKYGRLRIWYDKFRKIAELNAAIYNSNGEKIRELEEGDVEDYSDFANYSEYNDNRTKFVEMFDDKFPYTVEFDYELEYDGYLYWPSWSARTSLEPVEYVNFQVNVPENYNFRYWTNEDDIKPIIKDADGKITYLWEQKLLPKLSYDAVGEDIEDICLVVKIAPSDFEIDGHRGEMDSWKDFGLWYYNLCKGKDILPENAVKEIDELTKSARNDKEKIEILYHYLQSKTHYVSVQLGIGSWQPFDATYVYTNGYGDCKALSNFMITLLKYSDIKAYAVLIHNSNYPEKIIKDFPNDQFNHVIVCVPLRKDTIWLECTSNLYSPGIIGASNENRYALMITPEGGILVNTPSTKAEQNLQIKKIDVSLSNSGKAKVDLNIKYFGDQCNTMIYLSKQSTPREKEKYITRSFEVPDISLTNYSFEYDEANRAVVNLTSELSIMKYGTVMGKRIFLNPNLMERRKTVPADIEKRLSSIVFVYPYMDVDSIYYNIPENFKVETLPKEIVINSTFGQFTSKTIQNSDNSLLYIRELKIDDYSVPAKNYNEYRNFFSEVVNADKQTVVLIKK